MMVIVMVVVVEKNIRDGDEKGIVKMAVVTLLNMVEMSPK